MPEKKPNFSKTQKLLSETKEARKKSGKDEIRPSIANQSFVIELLLDEQLAIRSTQVLHVNKDESEKWEGWNQEKLARYILTQAGARQPIAPPEANAEQSLPPKSSGKKKEEEAAKQLVTGQKTMSESAANPTKPGRALVLSELQTIPESLKSPSRVFNSNEAFDVRFSFALEEETKIEGAPLEFTTLISVKSLDSHQRQSLITNSGVVNPGEKYLSIKVPAKALPAGTYRLEAALKLTPGNRGAKNQFHFVPAQISQVIHVQ